MQTKTNKAKETPYLLRLLDRRWKMGISKMPDNPLKPVWSSHDKEIMVKAAKEYAAWHDADPFAHGRIMLYMQQGYELPGDVLKEYTSRNKARAVAKALQGQLAAIAA